MIILITGTPGAGKTLYAVANLLRDLVGSEVDSTDEKGQPCKIRRTVYTNINGLLLEHDLIDGRDGGGLADWHKWAKPGALICFDEVQKEWGVRPNGSKVPDYIQALETHRHMGVDFIVITQGPQLIDQNLRALVGRHLHVRRMGGVGGSIVYEWDHCSRQLLYSKALAKKPFRYPKDVFSLYKSAELHTKPKMSLPGALWVTVMALVVAAFLVPYIKGRIDSKGQQFAEPKKPDAKPAQTPAPVVLGTRETTKHLAVPVTPRDVDAIKPPPPVPVDALEYAGTLVSDTVRLHLFKKPGGGVVKGQTLVAQGYKIDTDDDCSLTVSYGPNQRTFVCTLGPTLPPGQTPARMTETGQILQRLAKSPPAQILPEHKRRPWPTDGMEHAATRPI